MTGSAAAALEGASMGAVVLAAGLLFGAEPSGSGRALDAASFGPTTLESADSLYFAFRPRESLEVLERALTREGTRDGAGSETSALLWRSARAASAIALFEPELADRNRWLDRGAEYGRHAVARDPAGIEARYWLAVNTGLLALRAPSAGEIVDLARETREVAEAILLLRPDHAGAHAVLGREQMEIMMLPGWKRLLARIAGAGDLVSGASWEAAERLLERAVALEPDFVLHHLDAARLHLERDRPERAREHLRHVLALEPVHPPDLKFQVQAERLLEQLAGSAGATTGTGGGKPRD